MTVGRLPVDYCVADSRSSSLLLEMRCAAQGYRDLITDPCLLAIGVPGWLETASRSDVGWTGVSDGRVVVSSRSWESSWL